MQLAEWLVIQKEVLVRSLWTSMAEARHRISHQLTDQGAREVRMPTLQVEWKKQPDNWVGWWLFTVTMNRLFFEVWNWGANWVSHNPPFGILRKSREFEKGQIPLGLREEAHEFAQQYRADKVVTCVSRYLKLFFESLKEKTRNRMLEWG